MTEAIVDQQPSVARLERAEARLAEQNAALRRSNEELERFAYVVSHDLREPLRMIASYTELLEERLGGDLGDENRRYMNYVLEGTERMGHLLEDLLMYSRLDRQDPPNQRVHLGSVFDEAITDLGPIIETTHATIDSDPLPEVRGHPTQLYQVFLNLLGNSLKFRGSAPPNVRIHVETITPFVRVTVRDNGIGFDMEFSERIFDVFQRLHPRGEYPGTGIGLAACKKVIERHGGSIRAEARTGEGAAFVFTLPIFERSAD